MDSIDFSEAFNAFLREDAESGIIKATRAGWNGESYYVELFADGRYRVLAEIVVGNLYISPGLLIEIPALSDDEYNSEEESSSFFENAIEDLKERFAMIIDE